MPGARSLRARSGQALVCKPGCDLPGSGGARSRCSKCTTKLSLRVTSQVAGSKTKNAPRSNLLFTGRVCVGGGGAVGVRESDGSGSPVNAVGLMRGGDARAPLRASTSGPGSTVPLAGLSARKALPWTSRQQSSFSQPSNTPVRLLGGFRARDHRQPGLELLVEVPAPGNGGGSGERDEGTALLRRGEPVGARWP